VSAPNEDLLKMLGIKPSAVKSPRIVPNERSTSGKGNPLSTGDRSSGAAVDAAKGEPSPWSLRLDLFDRRKGEEQVRDTCSGRGAEAMADL
jgi:hypothetical protein